MHGMIHTELARFVTEKYGEKRWQAILQRAKLSDQIYLQIGSYPDVETLKIVEAAVAELHTSIDDFLEKFGFFIVPHFMSMYHSYIQPTWRTMDMLLNTEETIHRVVRMENPDADPPRLKFVQTGEKTLALYYDSPRKMLAVARGMIDGVAEWFGEVVELEERQCDRNGCTLDIRIL